MTGARPDPGPAAFGIRVDGLPAQLEALLPRPAVTRGATRWTPVGEAEIATSWPRDGARRISGSVGPDGALAFALEEHPTAGYRLEARGYGRFLLSPDGAAIRAAPAPSVGDRELRALVFGQLLPLAALLAGVEVFHASVVGRDGAALAISAPSRTGKSSLAIRLLLDGWRFVADDVLAVTLDDHGRPVAHAGPAVTSVRKAPAPLLDPAERRRLGRALDRDEDGVRYAVAAAGDPLPLRALYLLRRHAGIAQLAVRPQPDPLGLLAATFNAAVQARARLVRQLDVCAAIAAHAAVVTLDVPAGCGARETARRLARHAVAATAPV